MNTQIEIQPGMKVNEVIRNHPATVAVFAAHGIDSCCGGAAPLDEAARRHAVDLDALMAELASAAAAAT
jgi:iron-sulfur cluster repair protein YtfE (RIC family)